MPAGMPISNCALMMRPSRHRGEFVLPGPVGGIFLDPQIDAAALEGFEHGRAFAEIVEADLLEVEPAAIDGQVLAPILRIARVGDGAAGIDARDDVGTRREERLHRRILEGLRRRRVLGENRHQPEDERQLAILAVLERELDGALRQLFRRAHFREIRAVVGPALGLQQFEGKEHVVRRHGRAVGKLRFRIEREGDGGAVVGDVDGLGEEAIEREGFIQPARHQGLDRKLARACRGGALDDQRIEAVEGAGIGKPQTSAFRCIGVDVGEVIEIARLFGRAMERDCPLRGGAGRNRALRRTKKRN